MRNYEYAFSTAEEGSYLMLFVTQPYSLMEYICTHTMHLLQQKTLQQLSRLLCPGVSVTNVSALDLVKRILVQQGIDITDDGGLGRAMLERVAAMTATRSRPRPAEGESEEPGEAEDEAPLEEPLPEPPAELLEEAEQETRFLLGDNPDGNAALNEEETDDGLDDAAAAAAAAAAAKAKAGPRGRGRGASGSGGSGSAGSGGRGGPGGGAGPPPAPEPAPPLPPPAAPPPVPERSGAGGTVGHAVVTPGRRVSHFLRPKGCKYYKVEEPGQKPQYVAYLPRGVKSPTPEGKEQNWCSRAYAPGLRSESLAKAFVEGFLQMAVDLGKVAPADPGDPENDPPAPAVEEDPPAPAVES